MYNILVYICPMQSLEHVDTPKNVYLKIKFNWVACSLFGNSRLASWLILLFYIRLCLHKNSRPEKGPASRLGNGGPGPVFAHLMNVGCEGPAQLGTQDSLRASVGKGWPVQLLCTRGWDLGSFISATVWSHQWQLPEVVWVILIEFFLNECWYL